jgi:hypothetical protein
VFYLTTGENVMKVTIEFDSVSDRDVLEAVLSSLPTVGYKPPEYIHVVAPPPAEPFGAHGFGGHGKPPAPPVEPMALPAEAMEPPAPPPVDPLNPDGLVFYPKAIAAERDADGLPWDGRIHSSSKALLVDGKWRQRRNTDPAVVAAVTAELRAALGAPAAPVSTVTLESLTPQPSPMELSAVRLSPPVSTVPAYSGVTPALDAAIAPTEAFLRRDIPVPPVELPPLPALAVVPPPPPPADATMTFPEFMRAITSARIPPGTVLDACKAVGMPSIPALNQRPDLIPTVAAALGVSS